MRIEHALKLACAVIGGKLCRFIRNKVDVDADIGKIFLDHFAKSGVFACGNDQVHIETVFETGFL